MFGKNTRNAAPVEPQEPAVAPQEPTEPQEPQELTEGSGGLTEDSLNAPAEAPQEPDELTEARAKADNYSRQLFHARVEQTGLLIDPEDMPYDAALVDDPDALSAAVTDLVERKPHLRVVSTSGDLPAFGAGADSSSVSLTGLLRNNA